MGYFMLSDKIIIRDVRIDEKYCVEVSSDCYSLCIQDIKDWLSPFFSIYAYEKCKFDDFAKIKIVDNISKEYEFSNNVFFVNAQLKTNILYSTLMSIARMLYKYLAFLKGYQNIHAGCLTCGTNGILVVADRNQGKTTMILKAINDKDFSFLANDQVMYNFKKNHILGYPATVGIRKNSCEIEKQILIENKALWFVDDPFQTQPKPVIRIKDLLKIYKCNIVTSTNLNLVVNYEKSGNSKELTISNIGRVQFCDSNIKLPFEQTYKAELVKWCKQSVDYYMGRTVREKVDGNCIERHYVINVNIKCGEDRFAEMLREIKTNLIQK